MCPTSTEVDPLLLVAWEALSTRGWFKPTNADLPAIQEKVGAERCLFRSLLSLDKADELNLKLFNSSRSLLLGLTQAGLSLRLAWPREHASAVDEWLGRRLYFSATTNFSAQERFVSLVSSQLGRHGIKLPSWPTLVDAALQNARRDRERPLILPGTSLSEATDQYSRRADLNSLQIQLNDRLTIERWLEDLLSELEVAHATGSIDAIAQQHRMILRLSPPTIKSTAPEMASLPVQDRVAIALADRVMAIHIRSNGTIAQLTQQRLVDSRFPTGTVFLASTFGQHSHLQSELDIWLERGAVGWLLLEPKRQPDHFLSNCRKRCAFPFTQSLCAPMPKHWCGAHWNESNANVEWPFLAHCTRGNSGPLPNETLQQFRDRAWSAGVIPEGHSVSTLQQILNEGLIKGNSCLTRSPRPCVSFSAVPLAELLSRRQFRSHLGRWDWEPYGILVRREALESLGARSVVYGDEADYKQLVDDDKLYFQPRGKRDARHNQDWSVEREWRLRGDLTFTALPRDSIIVFVATKAEAQQVARRCQWPVIWKDT